MRRILLVEDNSIHRLLAEDFFEGQGYIVLGLNDGVEFFVNLDHFNPDIILLDLNLPEISGFTLLEQLQQSEWSHIPVIVVSAYAFEREKRRAKNFGIRRYFTKPVNLEVLSQAIADELAGVSIVSD